MAGATRRYPGLVTKESRGENVDVKTWNYDDELVQLISEKYHRKGISGAQAMIDAWTDIRDGKLIEICVELNIPEPLGYIHGLNTFSKRLMENDRLETIVD